MTQKSIKDFDVALVGGGIMSATLATILQELNPNLNIILYERLSSCGEESSEVLNNAGTGHAGNCELNYTPEINGKIKINKAIEISEMFELSLQLWSYIVSKEKQCNPESFITKSPHASFVFDEKNIKFLKKRFNKIKKEPLFSSMRFTEDPVRIKKYFPLLMKGRSSKEKVALTYYENGTDINFGNLTKLLIKRLNKNKKFHLKTNEHVKNISTEDNCFRLQSRTSEVNSKFVFLGAGGNSIKMLQRLKIKKAKGYAGFPISGKWLICKNKEVVKKHSGKVYSQAEKGSPPMSVPHLDIRKIGNEKYLLFGPFAGMTFKFLKNGSFLDLLQTIKVNNIKEMLSVAFSNLNLLIYLVKQTLTSHRKKMNYLRKFYPEARALNWKLMTAGQRVQIIKPAGKYSGKLQLGTEIIYNSNKTMAALLGASPGASVSVASMLEIVEKCFVSKNKTYEKKLKEIFPGYKQKLNSKPQLLKKIRKNYRSTLKLD
jgi:malate dehydrogenase (quinone)